jgi:CIC family chloride channel protein
LGIRHTFVSQGPRSPGLELTGEYQIILPLMLAVALAAGIGRLLSRDTIFTLELWRRGIYAPSPCRLPLAGGEGDNPDPFPVGERAG